MGANFLPPQEGKIHKEVLFSSLSTKGCCPPMSNLPHTMLTSKNGFCSIFWHFLTLEKLYKLHLLCLNILFFKFNLFNFILLIIGLASSLSLNLFCFVFNFYWNIVDLQHCVSLCCTAKWISYTYTYIHSFLDSFPI